MPNLSLHGIGASPRTGDILLSSGGRMHRSLLRWRFRRKARWRRVRREPQRLLPSPRPTRPQSRIFRLVHSSAPISSRYAHVGTGSLGCPAGSKTRQHYPRKPMPKASRAALDWTAVGGCPHTPSPNSSPPRPAASGSCRRFAAPCRVNPQAACPRASRTTPAPAPPSWRCPR